ncbi:MAG: urea ABC transporter permease subunit UrtB, partial [Verrucomicrobia bacterium]|nr:urea ABC transporter permease subunit UrtB [Verrucomicrobiota bacterium]
MSIQASRSILAPRLRPSSIIHRRSSPIWRCLAGGRATLSRPPASPSHGPSVGEVAGSTVMNISRSNYEDRPIGWTLVVCEGSGDQSGSALRRRLGRLCAWLVAGLAALCGISGIAAAEARTGGAYSQGPLLAAAVVQEDAGLQASQILQLADVDDPWIIRALGAWRQGGLFLQPDPAAADNLVPCLLDTQQDADGRSRLLRVSDGSFLRGTNGVELRFAALDLTAAETTSKLRRSIKSALDLLSIQNPDPRVRRDAAIKLGQERSVQSVGFLERRMEQEKDPRVRKAFQEALALIRTADTNAAVQADALRQLGEMRAMSSFSLMEDMEKRLLATPGSMDPSVAAALSQALKLLRDHVRTATWLGTGFRGVGLSAVLLVAALGLAITFGLMGVINMAHGEMIMIGAYTTYVVQRVFQGWWGATGLGFEMYFFAALAGSFVTAGVTGWILERGVIRFLYNRPLESLLATWGVSLVLQQLFRHVFGAANVNVTSPQWLSGSWEYMGVLLAFNRLFVIGFAVAIVLGTYGLLTRTSLGLQVRAVMQHRNMAACLGVKTDRINMLTFAFGSGLAGMAGACLSQIGNVGPSLGQSHIVDCFMIVVMGGVGSLAGTVCASM